MISSRKGETRLGGNKKEKDKCKKESRGKTGGRKIVFVEMECCVGY